MPQPGDRELFHYQFWVPAAAGSRWIESQLFGVSAVDPLVYGGTVLATCGIAAFATWQPARQASRVNPALTLRAE